jgi:pimeloyl-ACP methyl ester carboxylesterase
MFDLLDLLLLRRGIPADDRTVAFRRIDGSATAKVIYFLPWHTPYGIARQAGFVPLDFLACYEMPPAIVSSEPTLCAQAMRGLVYDAERLLHERKVRSEDAVIVGLSVGTYPATYLANRIGARLCSVASADRADLAVWQSPATRIIKHRAVQKGLRLSHYSEALDGTHPAQNLAAIAKDSVFVVGQRDPFVPTPRNVGLLQAIETHARDAQVIKLNAGHFKTLSASGRHQRTMLGITCPSRWSLQLRAPFFAQLLQRAADQ